MQYRKQAVLLFAVSAVLRLEQYSVVKAEVWLMKTRMTVIKARLLEIRGAMVREERVLMVPRL